MKKLFFIFNLLLLLSMPLTFAELSHSERELTPLQKWNLLSEEEKLALEQADEAEKELRNPNPTAPPFQRELSVEAYEAILNNPFIQDLPDDVKPPSNLVDDPNRGVRYHKGERKVLTDRQATTIILTYNDNNLVCNQVERGDSNDINIRLSPDIYDCDAGGDCDYDDEKEAFLRFDAGLDLNEVELLSMELSMEIEVDNDDEDDGSPRFYSSQPYDPNTLTWDNSPSTNHMFTGDKIFKNDIVVYTTNDFYDLQQAISGRYLYFSVRGDADGDGIFDAGVNCHHDETKLIITYIECDPSMPCCDATSHFKPEGTICQAAHDITCNNVNSCGGTAHVDQCTGVSAECPDNNIQIPFPSACEGLTCSGQFCSGSTFQGAGTCQSGSCNVPSSVQCPNHLTCALDQSCRNECSSDTQCVGDYLCSQGICIEPTEHELHQIQYDLRGNMINDGFLTYTYNLADELTSISAVSGELLETYVYDGLGNRVKKIIHADEGDTTTYYAGNYIKTESPTETTEEVLYSANGRLLAKSINGENYFYHPDHLGSTDVITDTQGNVVSNLNYEPYGQLLTPSDERHTYTGHEQDEHQVFMQGRYYNPSLAMFTQPDPVIADVYNPQDLNKYSYVRNNPYKYTDPTGEFADCAIGCPVTATVTATALYYGAGALAAAGILTLVASETDLSYQTPGALAGYGTTVYTPTIDATSNVIQTPGAFEGSLPQLTPGLNPGGELLTPGTNVGTNYGPLNLQNNFFNNNQKNSFTDGLNLNKQNHILAQKHNWNRVVNNPTNWNEVAQVIDQVLLTGQTTAHGAHYETVKNINGHNVIVRHTKDGQVGTSFVE